MSSLTVGSATFSNARMSSFTPFSGMTRPQNRTTKSVGESPRSLRKAVFSSLLRLSAKRLLSIAFGSTVTCPESMLEVASHSSLTKRLTVNTSPNTLSSSASPRR